MIFFYEPFDALDNRIIQAAFVFTEAFQAFAVSYSFRVNSTVFHLSALYA